MKKVSFVFILLCTVVVIPMCFFTGCQTQSGQTYSSSPESVYETESQSKYAQDINYPRSWKELSSRREAYSGSCAQNGNYLLDLSMETPQVHHSEYSFRLRSGLLPEDRFGSKPQRTSDFMPNLAHVSEDEIWVIVRPPVSDYPDDDRPGCGSMLAYFPSEDARKPLPLKHTNVKGSISGYIASVEVTQQFHNPYIEKIEAVYAFPLPQNAAINEFIMTVGTRKIRGIIRERQEAEQIYEQAKSTGLTASLLTQERPNIFTQKVANIEPGRAIDVSIKYFNTLAYADGWYEFVFPMVVGPRFNPPHIIDGVGAVPAGYYGASGQQTEIQYLKPHERSGHDISLSLDIHAGVKIEKIECPSHTISKKNVSDETAAVTLNSRDNIPNKDFILRYKVSGGTLKHSFLTYSGKQGNFFTLMLYPPEEYDAVYRVPMEMIFVLDCSGSMKGEPIATAKDVIKRALRKLGPDDTFQVIQFSSNASRLGAYPVAATPENIRTGLRYVDKLEGNGGTMMIEGIKAALDFPHDPYRTRLVSFMTDGYIGNEAEILAAVHDHLGDSRIFSFGIGSSVNRYLLDRMAKLGKGAVAYIGLNDNTDRVVDLFYDRIRHPVLTDISIDWGHLQVSDIYPSSIPDIFPGRPAVLTGQYTSHAPTQIRITGKVGNVYRQMTLNVLNDDSYYGHEGIGSVWARKKIEELSTRLIVEKNEYLAKQIKDTALRHGIMSAYTAFVAVDSSRKTAGDYGISVAVPVPVPDGVRYDTTVQGNDIYITP